MRWKTLLALALSGMLFSCHSGSSKPKVPRAPDPTPIVDPEPVCAVLEPIVPDASDLTAADFAGKDDGCPEQFEFCATRKAARWVTDLKNNAEAVQARCLVTVEPVTEE